MLLFYIILFQKQDGLIKNCFYIVGSVEYFASSFINPCRSDLKILFITWEFFWKVLVNLWDTLLMHLSIWSKWESAIAMYACRRTLYELENSSSIHQGHLKIFADVCEGVSSLWLRILGLGVAYEKHIRALSTAWDSKILITLIFLYCGADIWDMHSVSLVMISNGVGDPRSGEASLHSDKMETLDCTTWRPSYMCHNVHPIWRTSDCHGSLLARFSSWKAVVTVLHAVTLLGWTKSQAILMQSARLLTLEVIVSRSHYLLLKVLTWCGHAAGIKTMSPGCWKILKGHMPLTCHKRSNISGEEYVFCWRMGFWWLVSDLSSTCKKSASVGASSAATMCQIAPFP